MGGWSLEYVRALPLHDFNRIVAWINQSASGASSSDGPVLGDAPPPL